MAKSGPGPGKDPDMGSVGEGRGRVMGSAMPSLGWGRAGPETGQDWGWVIAREKPGVRSQFRDVTRQIPGAETGSG